MVYVTFCSDSLAPVILEDGVGFPVVQGCCLGLDKLSHASRSGVIGHLMMTVKAHLGWQDVVGVDWCPGGLFLI